ncbi:hypothetical protein KGY71_07470 [Candidatus Bipolaricaulota bacterium]|nr:hypothetical protein [Candidatus Bipolaricaulota bacterium]
MSFRFHQTKVSIVFLVLAFAITSGGISASGEILVKGDLLREFTLQPGETHQGEVAISNPGDEPTGFEVGKRDYLFYADGTNEYPPPGSTGRSNADWIEFSLPPDVSIEPGEEFPLNFEINVPDNSSLSGTYWSMIVIQATPPPAEAPEEGIGVRQVLRYGVQIAVNIGDTGERKIDLLGVEPIKQTESKTVRVNVKNVGERAVSPITRLELYDDQGKKYGPFEGSEYMIYPGCSVSYSIPLEEVPDEQFQSVIIIDNGDEYVWGARKEINFSSGDSSGGED